MYSDNNRDGYQEAELELEIVVPEKKRDRLQEIKNKLELIHKLIQIRKKR